MAGRFLIAWLVWMATEMMGLASAAPAFLPLEGPGGICYRHIDDPLLIGVTVNADANSRVKWVRLEPLCIGYDNVAGGRGDATSSIHYRVMFLASKPAREKLDVRAAFLRRHGPGTVYIAALKEESIFPEEFTAVKALHREFPGKVLQVVSRRGDDYFDYLEELRGTPFVMGPGVMSDGYHQTDQRVGSDCAALAIYGQRRMGMEIPYCGPAGVVRYLTPLTDGELRARRDGVYVGVDGHPMPIGSNAGEIQRGMIVHFGQQVSVFSRDAGVKGLLDTEDIVFESWGRTPREIAIRDSDFCSMGVRVFRWSR